MRVPAQWFNAVDSDRDGLISSPELQRGLAKGGLHYSLQHAATMIRRGAKFLADCSAEACACNLSAVDMRATSAGYVCAEGLSPWHSHKSACATSALLRDDQD